MASKVLNETEAQILVIEQSAPRLRWLHPDTYHNVLVDLLGEISLITGVLIYANGSREQAFQLEIIKRLLVTNPKFYNLNKDEVVQAFYMNAAGMFPDIARHYNRELNVEFMGDVLLAYVQYKSRFLGNKLGQIQKLLSPPPAQPTMVPISLDDWMDMINADLALVRAGQANMVFNCALKYKILRQLGYIEIRSRTHWWSWYRWSAGKREEALIRKPPRNETECQDRDKMLDILQGIVKRNEIHKMHHRTQVLRMRADIYLQHLQALASCAIFDLFEQVLP